MAAYIIAHVEVHDAKAYEEYKTLAQASIAQYGGRYRARGGQVRPLEGGWTPTRVVILEFDTMEQAQTWWSSPEYTKAKNARADISVMRSILVEGVPG